jgi:hypothetical protein
MSCCTFRVGEIKRCIEEFSSSCALQISWCGHRVRQIATSAYRDFCLLEIQHILEVALLAGQIALPLIKVAWWICSDTLFFLNTSFCALTAISLAGHALDLFVERPIYMRVAALSVSFFQMLSSYTSFSALSVPAQERGQMEWKTFFACGYLSLIAWSIFSPSHRI